MTLSRRSMLIAGAASAGSALLGPMASAQAAKLKMILNWRYQGPQSWFFQAQDMGFLREEGVDLEIDQGEGSAAAITKVAQGAYDVGFGDMNALISLAATKPEDAPIAVYAMFNNPPFTIAVRSDSPIRTAKDLEGKTIGGPANDAALRLFPAFAKLAGIDASKVTVTNMQPNLREQMLQRGQVDGVFGFVNTIAFSARLAGIDPDKDFRFINYVDHGMDLYSNTLVVSKKLARENPKAVSGIVRAFNRGLAETLKDFDKAVDAVAKREAADQEGCREGASHRHPQGRDEPPRDRHGRHRRRERRALQEGHRHRRGGQPTAARAGAGGDLHAPVPASGGGADQAPRRVIRLPLHATIPDAS